MLQRQPVELWPEKYQSEEHKIRKANRHFFKYLIRPLNPSSYVIIVKKTHNRKELQTS